MDIWQEACGGAITSEECKQEALRFGSGHGSYELKAQYNIFLTSAPSQLPRRMTVSDADTYHWDIACIAHVPGTSISPCKRDNTPGR